jgi:hypothetical protein
MAGRELIALKSRGGRGTLWVPRPPVFGFDFAGLTFVASLARDWALLATRSKSGDIGYAKSPQHLRYTQLRR